ncbi:MAG: hypothetical protein Q9222_002466, partial [Ikaeria aurantiellina]
IEGSEIGKLTQQANLVIRPDKTNLRKINCDTTNASPVGGGEPANEVVQIIPS